MRPLELGLQAFGPYHQGQIINFAKTREAGIFLIHGNTGAGKSSILEAMVWALYGKDGIGDKKKEQIRYTKASISETTFVRFDFSVGTDIYRVYRELRPQKKQGTNELSSLNEKVVVAKRNLSTPYESNELDAAYTAFVENGIDDTTKRIASILSMDEKQFTKIIMIPQGKFKDLLLSPPDEREELLCDLLDLHRFDHYEEYLGQRVKDLKSALDLSFQKEAELKTNLAENGGDRVSELRQEFDQLERDVALKSKLLQGLGAQVERARAFEHNEAKRAQLAFERETLLQKSAEIEQKRTRLALFDQFKGKSYLVVDLKRLENEAKSNDEKQKELGQQLGQFDLESLTRTVQEHEAAVGLAQAELTQEGPRLQLELNNLKEIAKLGDQVDRATLALDEALKHHGPREESFKRLGLERERQVTLQAKIKGQELFVQGLRDLYRSFRSFGEKLIDRQNVLSELRLKKRDHMLQIQKHRDCHDQIPVAQTMVDHWNKLEKQFAHAMLAKDLVHSEACPVCGSHEHPNPPTLPEDSIDLDRRARDSENLEKLKREIVEAKTSYEQLKRDIDLVESKLAKEKEQFDGLRAEFDGFCKNSVSKWPELAPLVENMMEACRQELSPTVFESLTKDLTQKGKDEGAKLEDLLRQVMSDDSYAAAEKAFRESEAKLTQCKANVDLLKSQLDEKTTANPVRDRTEAQILGELDRLNHEFSRLQALVSSSRSDLAEATKRHDGLKSELQSLEGRSSGLKLDIERLRAQIEELKRQTSLDLFALDYSFEGFDSLETKREIEAHQNRLQEIKFSLEALKGDGSNRPEHSSTELEAELVGLQTELEGLQHRRGHMQKNFEVIEGFLKKLEAVQKDRAEQESNYAALNEIAQSFKGANEAKLSFKRFVIGMYLDRILIEANGHLNTMTMGRYQFKRSELAIGRQQKAGLNLEIIDSYSGDSRLVNTLSGGESFMASLSLALGLSAYVQKLSGGKKMEAFFIDEGFGTLDEDTLEQAMSVLETIGKSGRTLGIISHVKELKERIPLKLFIKGSKTGSQAQWSV